MASATDRQTTRVVQSLLKLVGLDWVVRERSSITARSHCSKRSQVSCWAGIIGMMVDVWLGRAQLVAGVLDPFIMMFYSLPKVALAPLFVLWFGIGIDMKILLTATIVFFLVFLNTYTGVRGEPRTDRDPSPDGRERAPRAFQGGVALGCDLGFRRAAAFCSLCADRRNRGRAYRLEQGAGIPAGR